MAAQNTPLIKEITDHNAWFYKKNHSLQEASYLIFKIYIFWLWNTS